MDNKGFTLIEVIVSLSIVSFFMLFLIGVPTGIMRDYKDYSQVSQVVIEENTIRSSMAKDLNSLNVSLEGESLVIGNKVTYNFKSDGVYRKEGSSSELKLTSIPYNVKVVNDILTISNDVSELKYNIGSSFNKYQSKEVVPNEK